MNHYYEIVIKNNSKKINDFENKIKYYLNEKPLPIANNVTLAKQFEFNEKETIKTTHYTRLFYSFALILDFDKEEYKKNTRSNIYNSLYFSIDFKIKECYLQSISLKTDYGSIILNNSGVSFLLDNEYADKGDIELIRFKIINEQLVHDDLSSYDEDFLQNGLCMSTFLDKDKKNIFHFFKGLRELSKSNPQETLDFLLNSNEIKQESVDLLRITKDIDLNIFKTEMKKIPIRISDKTFDKEINYTISKKPSK